MRTLRFDRVLRLAAAHALALPVAAGMTFAACGGETGPGLTADGGGTDATTPDADAAPRPDADAAVLPDAEEDAQADAEEDAQKDAQDDAQKDAQDDGQSDAACPRPSSIGVCGS